MPTSGTYRSAGATLLVLAAVTLAACAGDDGSSDPIETAPTIALPTVTRASTVDDVVETTAAPTTEAPVVTEATVAPTTEATVAPTTSTTTTSTTVPPTTTTEPDSVKEMVLSGDGIGFAKFGADPDVVIDFVTSILGGNTADTGWVDPFTFAVCDGTVARKVSWGVLDLHFGDLSPFADGRRHFHGWDYGRDGEIGKDPEGLRTAGGVTLGSRVVDMLAEFPDAAVNAEQPDINSPANFYVSDNFRGLLTGTEPEDVVTVMFGGYGCGE